MSHKVVIVGGGFGGLYAAKNLRHPDIDLTLVDRRNFHLFQPLLYQVATGGLSPGDISSPLRAVLHRNPRARVWQADAVDIDVSNHRVILRDGHLSYDTLIVATGASHHYFGNDQWADDAPGLKSIEDALDIRRRILLAYETAEREPDADTRLALLTFLVVGGGPTGVELAGSLAELARTTLKNDFRRIDPRDAKIILVEGEDRILPTYPRRLSSAAEKALEKLGVNVRTKCLVTRIDGPDVALRCGERDDALRARTILWAAGVRASRLGTSLAKQAGIATDGAGRVPVEPDLTIPGHPEIFVIGDLAKYVHQGGTPLPGVAPVAMQQGRYAAKVIRARLARKSTGPFHYIDRGSLAVIGRNAAVADIRRLHFAGYPAWLTWALIHIYYLIEFDNRLLVMIQWAINYLTRKRGARLITGADPQPLVQNDDKLADDDAVGERSAS
jgi:NADH dehydrogenase